MSWFKDYWRPHPVKQEWINGVESLIKELWLEYKGKNPSSKSSLLLLYLVPVQPDPKKIYTSARAYKRRKVTHQADAEDVTPFIDRLQDYLDTNVLEVEDPEHFNVIQYW